MRWIILGLALAVAHTPALATTDKPICSLTQADKDANISLSFEGFDQQGILPSTWRTLDKAGCREQAIDALKDYSIRGPVLEPYHQRILLFHLGQLLAAHGQEAKAAEFIAFSREPRGSRPPTNTLNWNDYVIGTWAFLTKNRQMLAASVKSVLATPGRGNQVNGAFLQGLERCFDKPYSVAYNPRCGEKPE